VVCFVLVDSNEDMLQKQTKLLQAKVEATDHSKRSKEILKYYLMELSFRGKDFKHKESL